MSLQSAHSSSVFPHPIRTLLFQLDVQELSFQLGAIEPLFLSLTFYNISTDQRLCETFKVSLHQAIHSPLQMHLNDARVMSLLSSQSLDEELRATAALFTLPMNTVLDDVYLMVRLDRVLRGEEVDDAVEPYFKNVAIKPKEKDVLLKEIRSVMLGKQFTNSRPSLACSRLSSYHQPIAFAINPLTEDGQLISGRCPCPAHHVY